MNKNIVTIYYVDDWSTVGDPISSIPTRKSFEDMHEMGAKKGFDMFRASIKWYDLEKGVFTKTWKFREGKWQKEENPIKPDLIFDKVGGVRDYELFDLKMKIASQVKVFNNPMFRTLLDNKLAQYLILGNMMPKTTLATNVEEATNLLENVGTEKVVIKPPYGSGGFGIIIDEKNKIDVNVLEYPVLIQEFVKSEKGIPGFSKKGEVADLRLVFFNHEFKYAISRIAKEGSLFTNFHQGASASVVPEEMIPQSAKKMAAEVIEKISIFPEAQYSLDFMFDENDNPILIEMNTTPGVDLLKEFGDPALWEQNFDDLSSLAL